MKIEYRHTNSGGRDWLTEQNWLDLESAGWAIDRFPDDGIFTSLANKAHGATKDFETPVDAMVEFEKITGQDVCDDGCNCCGAPHSFSWDGGYVSGKECADHLFKKVLSYRELLEEVNRIKK